MASEHLNKHSEHRSKALENDCFSKRESRLELRSNKKLNNFCFSKIRRKSEPLQNCFHNWSKYMMKMQNFENNITFSI